MTQFVDHHSGSNYPKNKPFKVWVLSPFVQTGDENLDYYYDYKQSIEEYKKVFEKLEMEWVWQPVTIDNFENIIDNIALEKPNSTHFPIVLNLCDGDEINGTPGISVIRKLIANNLVFTGADEHFYQVTTSKIPMKQAFDDHEVAHASWQIIRDTNIDDDIFNRIGSPIIVKPAVSGGSMGVGIKNVVRDKASLIKLIEELNGGYRGWNLMADGLIAEKYISGREFTALICGNHDDPDSIHVYNPVERVFHESLPDEEKFLSFDRLWEIYEAESAMPESAHFFEYHPVDISLSEKIKVLSKASFIATGGIGYARVDIRMDQHKKELYLLEINAQCGISEDENYTSIGAILKFEKQPFHSLVSKIIHLAINKHSNILEKETMNSTVNHS